MPAAGAGGTGRGGSSRGRGRGRGARGSFARGAGKGRGGRPPSLPRSAERRRRKKNSNARKKARVEAVRSLNALAVERGRDAIRAKNATSTVVEHLVRWLETRCDGDAAAALRSATEAWVQNGGELSVPLACAGEPPGPEVLGGASFGWCSCLLNTLLNSYVFYRS